MLCMAMKSSLIYIDSSNHTPVEHGNVISIKPDGTHVKTVNEDKNIMSACIIMKQNDIGCIIVDTMKGDGEPVGMITERDVSKFIPLDKEQNSYSDLLDALSLSLKDLNNDWIE